jgi:tRNA A37 threonylcarbamoyladenosine dehydratase
LVDFDYVTLSSLNRHATATLADVGTPKVKCVERFLKGVAPWAHVDACVDIWRKEEGRDLLDGYDWVVGKSGIGIICDCLLTPQQTPSTTFRQRWTS